MALAPSGTQLGCGRDIDEVWDHIGSRPDPHELTCPYCQAARADLANLAQATQAMRDDDATNPDLEPSPHVLDRILAVARAEVRRGRRLPLDQPRGDTTSANTVSEQAVTAVIRRIGDRIAEVQIRRCVLSPDPTDNQAPRNPSASAPAGTLGAPRGTPGRALTATGAASVAVSLRISIARDQPVVEVSNQLRAAVIDAVMQEVGMHVVAVDIAVEDLHDA